MDECRHHTLDDDNDDTKDETERRAGSSLP